MTEDPVLTVVAELEPSVGEIEDHVEIERELARLLRTLNPRPRDRGRYAPRPGTRRRARSGLALAGVAAAAVVLVVITGQTRRRLQPPSPTPSVQLTAQVAVMRARHALALAQRFIVRSVEVTRTPAGAQLSRRWDDQLQTSNSHDEEYLPGGSLALDTATTVSGRRYETVSIDYRHRVFTRQTGVIHGLVPWSFARVTIKDLSNGWDLPIGHARIGGRRVLVLSNREPGMHRQLWVDPRTYLPLRMTAHWQGGSYVIAYTFIRRTPHSLRAALALTIPAGFTRVTALPGD